MWYELLAAGCWLQAAGEGTSGVKNIQRITGSRTVLSECLKIELSLSHILEGWRRKLCTKLWKILHAVAERSLKRRHGVNAPDCANTKQSGVVAATEV